MTNHSHRHPLPNVELLFVDCGKLGIGLSVSSSCELRTITHSQRLLEVLRSKIPFTYTIREEATVTFLGGCKVLNGVDRKNLMNVQLFVFPNKIRKNAAIELLKELEFEEGLYLTFQGSDHICATAN